ncbi:MAG TPA: electron transport complex subunit RsxC [Candidatus Marinimicrobia bacterium]|nr:electron transport complex subunit RsxC [Candidatus Neomarinimicrobiota bacterium]
MKLKTFKKGVHPAEFKSLSDYKSIEKPPLPTEVFIPLQQHVGAACVPVVEKGMEVKTGQLIGKSGGFISSNIHASISGKVKAIEKLPHPLGNNSLMINIVSDGRDEWIELPNPILDWENLTSEQINEIVLNAGIVGLGGAAFPTQVKLNPPKNKTIDTFILNGCECEPYLTTDHRIMIERSEEVVLGLRIMMKALGVSRAIIGIEANKPDAIAALTKATEKFWGIIVQPLKVKYPQGAEKMLIDAVLKRQVPAGGLPMDVGVVVNNVGTALAVAEAVTKRKPLIERVVTVTGQGVREPKNVLARIGTPFQNLIDFCGGLTNDTVKVIMGGPMMGVAQASLSVPIIKATCGIVCLTDKIAIERKEYPCIKCGACLHVCPMNLIPTRLARLSQFAKWDEAEQYGIVNCIECGSCAFICPASIPLVHHIRIGKMRVTELQRKRKNEEKTVKV